MQFAYLLHDFIVSLGKLASVSHWICPVLVPDGRCNVSSRIIYNQVISHLRYVTNAGHVWGHVARRMQSIDLVTWSLASCSSGPSNQLDHMTYTQFLTFSILYRFQHWEVEKYTANFNCAIIFSITLVIISKVSKPSEDGFNTKNVPKFGVFSYKILYCTLFSM